MSDDYQFDDLDASLTESVTKESAAAFSASNSGSTAPATSTPPAANNRSGGYASELFSKKIEAKFRTFYIDLKESSNGKFVKISEKSHGRKSTIMMDGEDVAVFMEALKEVQDQL